MKRSASHSAASAEFFDGVAISTRSADHDDLSMKEIWKYSRTRRIAYWMKKSVRNAVTPNLHAIYEDEDANARNNMDIGSIRVNDNNEYGESFGAERTKAPLETSLDFSSCSINCVDTTVRYCENIDEAMSSLYSFPEELHEDVLEVNREIRNHDTNLPFTMSGNQSQESRAVQYYDWLLDGFPMDEGERITNPIQDVKKKVEIDYEAYQNYENMEREMKKKGHRDECSSSVETDGELISALAGMELEDCSSSSCDDDTVEMMDRCRDLIIKSSSFQDVSCISSATNSSCDEHDMTEGEMINVQRSTSSDEFECDHDVAKLPGMQAHGFDNGSKHSVCKHVPNLKWDSIPSFLPFEDPSTPVGSFIRRLQVENELYACPESDVGDFSDNDHDMSSIDKETFLKILESVPWEDSDDDLTMEQDEYLIENLSSLDELSHSVTGSLLHEINQKEIHIQNIMKQVQNVNIDINSALSCTKQAKMYSRRVKGRDDGYGCSRDGVLGGLYVIQESNRRDKLRMVECLLKSIEELITMEASIFDFVDDFVNNLLSDGDGLTTFLDTCETLKNRLLRDKRFLNLKCLDESRERVSHIMEYSCRRIEEELMLFLYRGCKVQDNKNAHTQHWDKTKMSEYNVLFDARVVFDSYRLQETRKNLEQDSDEECIQSTLASSWSSCITRALCFEADRCLPRALLHPTGLNEEADISSEFDSNLSEIGSKLEQIQLFNEDSASLRSLAMNLVSIRFEFDQKEPNLVGTFHKLCLSLANVLHAHFKISEWQKDIVDDNISNSTETRCESPLQEQEERDNDEINQVDVSTKDDHTKSTSSSNCSRSSGSSNNSQTHASLLKGENFPNIPQCISGPQNIDLGDTNSGVLNAKKSIRIRDVLLDARLQVWQHCKCVLVTFLKTIITFYEKKEQTNWSLTWMQDLESFHDIFQLSKQIMSLGKEFIGDISSQSISTMDDHEVIDCELKETLSELFQHFLGGANVEAMTEIGIAMANETWDLFPVPMVDGVGKPPYLKVRDSVHRFLLEINKSIAGASSRDDSLRLWMNKFCSCEGELLFTIFGEGNNPFLPLEDISLAINDDCSGIPMSNNFILNENSDPDKNSRSLYEKVASYISTNRDELVLGTKSALNGLARWTVQLLDIEAKLPIISDQVAMVLCNIYDLYFLTVFRLCTGNSESEDIVLGKSYRSDNTFNSRFPQDLPSRQVPLKKVGANHHNHRRRRSHKENAQAKTLRLLSILLSKYCEADINAPIDVEEDETSRLRNFIQRGQAALSSMVSLENIEKWSLCHDGTSKKDVDLYSAKCLESLIGASSSCLLVGCIYEVAVQSALSRKKIQSKKSRPLSTYLEHMTRAISYMHTVCLRMCGTRAILGRSVVSNIIALGEGWAEARLNEHCNTYVDRLSDRYGILWAQLSSSRLTAKLLSDTWEYVVESGYLSLLEGFSKVYDCSTEGRALMSIDLATFSSNINRHTLKERFAGRNAILQPPTVAPHRGMQYVDTYIKVFYFPEKDVQSWVMDNKGKYHINHLLTLVSIGAHSQLAPKELALVLSRREELLKK